MIRAARERSFGSWFRIGAGLALGTLVVFLAAAFLYLARAVLVIVLVSIIFAQAISPLVLRLRRVGAKRSYAVLVIFALALMTLAGIVWLLGQALVSELGQLVNAWPEIEGHLWQLAEQLPQSPLREAAEQVLGSPSRGPSVSVSPEVPGAVLKSAIGIVELIFGIFTAFVITFYWIEERLIVRRLAFNGLPPEQRERATRVWDDVEEKLGAWVRGQLLMMLTIAGIFAVGLTALGVHYALPLALFAGLVEIVPFIGPYVATVLPVLVAISQNIWLGVYVIAFGLLVQLIEGNVLVPRVMGRAVGVSHLTVILGLLVGGKLMGVAGALLAVPIAAAIQVILVDLEVFGPKEPSPEAPAVPDAPPQGGPVTEEILPAHRSGRVRT